MFIKKSLSVFVFFLSVFLLHFHTVSPIAAKLRMMKENFPEEVVDI
jgi:hypothetical protein